MKAFAKAPDPKAETRSSSVARGSPPVRESEDREQPFADLQYTRRNQPALQLTAPGGSSPPREKTGGDQSWGASWDFSKISIFPPDRRVGSKPSLISAPILIQPKLAVGDINDPLEHEADRVAGQVMRMPEPRPQRKCACGGTCPECKKQRPDQGHGPIQMKHIGPSGPAQMQAPAIVHEVLRSPGQPLDRAVRAYMEPRFGFDFGRVRVHSDSTAADSAKALGARAYTVGRDVVFGNGQFAPDSVSGRALLAHELAHVVQQDAGRQSSRSTVIRRANDSKGTGSATGCTPGSEAAMPLQPDNPFLIKFEVGRDFFQTGEEFRLRTIALGIAAAARLQAMKIRIDGFASEEGDEKFNKTLSCARALKVGAIFQAAGIKSSDIQLFSHGATVGDRPSHRSVLISGAAVPSTAKPAQPTPAPVPKSTPVPKSDDKDKPKEPPDPDMWPHFRRHPILDRLKRRLRDLKDALKRGADILGDLNDLADDIINNITKLALIIGAVSVTGGGAGVVEELEEIAALKKLLQEVDALQDSLPRKPAPLPSDRPLPPPGRGANDPDYDKPDIDPESKPEPEPEPKEKKPEPKPKDDKDKPTPRADEPDRGPGGRWGCDDVRCIVYPDPQAKEPNRNCPKRVIGSSRGWPSYDAACLAAQKDANSKVPRGCIKRHCNCRTKCRKM
jgi:hypothetical protein